MKSTRDLLVVTVIAGGLFTSANPILGQDTGANVDWNTASDSQVLLQAVEQLPTIPATSAPKVGTFYSAQHAPGTRQAWPPLPANAWQLPVWNLGNGVYLLDDLQMNYSQPLTPAGMVALDGSGWPGGITNVSVPSLLTRPVHTTNDLWLEMNGVTNQTAYLTIHPPWNVTNEVYDLYYTNNLTSPDNWSWSWVLRSFAGQTNLVVNNATDTNGFYWLGPPNDIDANDSMGTNFWLAFYDVLYENLNLSLYISSPVGASGTLTYYYNGAPTTNTFTVAAGGATKISIPSDLLMIADDLIENKGIHVTATQPVSVYAVDYSPGGLSTAFTAYSTSLLGTNYCLMAYPGYSELAVLATADNTTVTITPSATADLDGSLWNNPITNLQAGQTYQLQSTYSGDDVTGTRIASDKPIVVLAGAYAALVPDDNTTAANPLVQEQLPVESWGTLTLGLSFAGRTNGDTYRVLAVYDDTVVTITGRVVTIVNEVNPPWQVTKTNEALVVTNQAGMPFDIIVEGPVVFQADKPIQVAQFANGNDFDNAKDAAGHYVGDPCEILLPHTGHYLETNIVVSLPNDNSSGDFSTNYLNLIVPQSATNSTFVDALPVAVTNFVPIETSGYYGARLAVTNGTHKVTSFRPVGVEVYGWGYYDAYGYFGGVVK